ncbi:hypothetical protein TeGR_g13663 [Tetraparma gracilis]|uniref:Nudix hydrolase domain-containing protein n=1 Tax=Tetraparma gracilis TaxID=2962635 RepID=A0ABQ6N5Y0_9STRA|nr:hypothetical protein TeGR_g13663 [Tetraparma gracilis]
MSLLFTRRSHQISQGGQIAFPGGKVERSDEDRTATAVRETHEEIGLPPEALRVVGLLDDIPNYDNTQSVTPVVAVVDPAFDTANLIKSPEVSAIFSVPVPDLEKDENWTTKEMEWKGHQVTQFFFDCRAYPSAGTGEALWGLTAYCTLSLLLSMSDASNPSKNGVVARHHLTLLEQYDRRLQMGKDALEDMEAAKLELAASKSPNRVE